MGRARRRGRDARRVGSDSIERVPGVVTRQMKNVYSIVSIASTPTRARLSSASLAFPLLSLPFERRLLPETGAKHQHEEEQRRRADADDEVDEFGGGRRELFRHSQNVFPVIDDPLMRG